ncbi:MAG TPA: MMPL family transporter [Acidimicrobiales bacterium]|nr:MMPL family transporter [Acidimicrobiales bacterium]
MLGRLAERVVARRKAVLVAAVLLIVACGAIGGDVAKHLSTGGFDDPDAESYKADQALLRQFQGGQPNVVLLVTAHQGGVDAPDVAAAGRAITQELAGEPDVPAAVSYWSLGAVPPLRSKDGRQALVLARVSGSADHVSKRMKTLTPKYTRTAGAVTVQVGGFAEVFRQVGTTIQKDLAKAEAIAIPITLLLLVLVFGSVVAAALPLGIGILAIFGTFFVLRVLAAMTQVSVFALNMTTAMGLGLAIDYSLFVVSRYREELRAGRDPHEAVVRTVRTAGRTVTFSALTVAASLAALLVFPLSFLRSFAYAGIAVVAWAALGAVVLLPALLAVLGRRVDALVLFKRHPREVGEGFWHKAATTVMRRPLPIATSVAAILLILGAPFLHVRFGLPDDRVLPPSVPGRQVSDQIRTNFSSNEANALSVVALGVDPAARAADIDAYAKRLSNLPGVARVDAASGSYLSGARVLGPSPISARFVSPAGTFLSVVPTVEPYSPAGERLVTSLRQVPAPFDVQTTGASAQLVDSKHALFDRMPLAGLIIALVTFAVLFLMFGSVLVPAKAVVLNLLSLTATFGAMVFVFQGGHGSGLLHFTPTGLIDTTTPILMFCVAFGLSMDYEVFLLSRIKEEHDRGSSTVASVAMGLERTGRIVTAAAALLAVVFVATATSKVTFIKLFGVGLTMAVLMDATLIRAALVPAFMRLAGNANWWAPAPLRRIYERWGISETDGGEALAASTEYNVPMRELEVLP